MARLPEEPVDGLVLVDDNMHVARGNAHIGLPGRIAHFGQRSTARQRVADECVPAVMYGQSYESFGPEHFAGRAEAFPQRVAG